MSTPAEGTAHHEPSGARSSSAGTRDLESQPLLGSSEPSPKYNPSTIARHCNTFLGFASIALVGLIAVDSFLWLGLAPPSADSFKIISISITAAFAALASRISTKNPTRADQCLTFCAALMETFIIGIHLFFPSLRRQVGLVGFALEIILLAILVLAIVSCQYRLDHQTVILQQTSQDSDPVLVVPPMTFYSRILTLSGLLLIIGTYVLIFLRTTGAIVDAVDLQLTPLGSLPQVELKKDDPSTGSVYLHVACSKQNSKGPLILIDSDSGSAELPSLWALSSQKAGAICYFDRPGFGFSDPAPSPLSVKATAKLMLKALEEGEPRLFQDYLSANATHNHSVILVGHGTGGIYSEVMASQIGPALGGIMLVDAVHKDLFFQHNGVLCVLREFFIGLANAFNFAKIETIFTFRNSLERVYGQEEFVQPRFHRALVQQALSARGQSRRDITLAENEIPTKLPLLVVSSSSMISKYRNWAMYQRLLLKLSENPMAWKIIDGPHQLWQSRKASVQLTELLDQFLLYREY